MENIRGLQDSFFVNSKVFSNTAHFYHNACAIVMSSYSKMIQSFVSSSLSLILKKEYCEYRSEMKRNNLC